MSRSAKQLCLPGRARGLRGLALAWWAVFYLIPVLVQAVSPVAWWNFDNPAALGQDSAGTNDAALVGAPAYCSGLRNGGIVLNGAGDYLSVPTSPSLEITGPMTVLLWVKPIAADTNCLFVCKAANWDDGQMAYILDLVSSPTGLHPRFAVSSDGSASGSKVVVSPDALTTGQWHLIAGVYSGASIVIYVDGKFKAGLAYNGGIYAGEDPLCIGGGWDAPWNGALDEVRIFNVALTAAQILAEFQGGASPLNAGLSRYFPRVPLGQARTNQVTLTNIGFDDLIVASLRISGEDAAYFQLLSPSGGVILHSGVTNAVPALIRFAPKDTRAYNALLTISSSVNTVLIPLTGQGTPDKTLALDLQRRDITGQPMITHVTLQGSQLAAIVVDTWDSHPDSTMASRVDALVPRMNLALDAARDLGITVIFSPSDCLADFNATPYRTNIMNLPNHVQGNNGFNPPLPPYRTSTSGMMVPPNKSVPAYPKWAHQHPDLVVKSGDLASLSRQEIFNYCAENGISYLLYLGAAANMCVAYTRDFSMVPMKRYCNLEPILVRDLTDSMTLNDRSPTNYSALDHTMTPDRGHREVIAHDETYICSTISAAQLMQQWAPGAYTALVSSEPNLLCNWRLGSKGGYRISLDIQRNQSCWWYDQTNALAFDVPGVLIGDTNTALHFEGATTVLVSPIYRAHIPTNSPLVSLSATNFTLEVWVRAGALNSNQWFFSHDNGLANGVDVLLGLNESNRFQFIVGTDVQHKGFGDVLQSATVVTEADVAGRHWFHIIATHDVLNGTVALYVNGNLDTQSAHVCHPVSLASAPHLGSRGEVAVDPDGTLNNPGFDFFRGALDEPAIYSAPLDSDSIRLHYQTAQGLPAEPVTLSALTQGNQMVLSWPAFSGGLWLQASDSLLAPRWRFLTVPVLELNGMNWAVLSTTNGSRFFRLGSQ